MKHFIFIAAFLVITSARADEPPLIDAHSQVDHRVDLADIVPLMDRAAISRVLLGTRGKISFKDVIELARKHPGRITPSVRTKGSAYAENRNGYYKKLAQQIETPGFGAISELILWHARKGNKAPQWVIPPTAPQVRAALKAALDHGWPFIIHIEFRAAREQGDGERFLGMLEDLLRAYPDHPFPLIHMGQLNAAEAARLIGAHKNIYFITSHANSISTAKSNQPWTNMFDGRKLKPEWKSLMTAQADRFILGFDNVWADHWGDYYVEQAELWREAFRELPHEAAHLIAHKNAERLWGLEPLK